MNHPAHATPILETRGLTKAFGALTVADGIDFALARGARHALIGPNGAGKTTLVNLLTGALAPSAGRVLLDGSDITRLSQAARVGRGLVRSFQITSLLRGLSVLDNVAIAIAEREGASRNMWRPASRFGRIRDEAAALLGRLGIAAEAGRRAESLAYGRQRLVEIALALALAPRVLLLDEPAAGVPSSEAGRILEVLSELPAEISILVIEHDMDLVFRFASRITVLVQGRVLAEGAPGEIAADDRVRAAYLGEPPHA